MRIATIASGILLAVITIEAAFVGVRRCIDAHFSTVFLLDYHL